MAVQNAQPYRFTADDYVRMAETGIIRPDARVELIDGEIVQMTPIGPRHNASVDRLNHLLVGRVGNAAIVRVQGSVRLEEKVVPQPDFTLLRPRDDYYERALPGPADVLLVVEVADSSLAYDRSEKARVYARAEIPEYWLLDLPQSQVLVHTDPTPSGYRHVEIRRAGDTWSPQRLADLTISGRDIFG